MDRINPQRLYGFAELEKITGVKASFLKRQRWLRRLSFTKLGSRVFLRGDTFLRWIEENTEPAPSKR